MRARLVVLAGAAGLLLAGCVVEQTPDVTPSQSTTTGSVSPGAPTSPDDADAALSAGTREAPLSLGESRALSDDSAWTVRLNASTPDGASVIAAENEFAPPPVAGEAFLIGNFSVTVDAAALAQQGIDLANEGADPAWHLSFEYVAADGTSFDALSGTLCSTLSSIYSAGTLYADGTTATGDVCISVPEEKLHGGLWRVANIENDNVWISPE
jgi:hypothetical protein